MKIVGGITLVSLALDEARYHLLLGVFRDNFADQLRHGHGHGDEEGDEGRGEGEEKGDTDADAFAAAATTRAYPAAGARATAASPSPGGGTGGGGGSGGGGVSPASPLDRRMSDVTFNYGSNGPCTECTLEVAVPSISVVLWRTPGIGGGPAAGGFGAGSGGGVGENSGGGADAAARSRGGSGSGGDDEGGRDKFGDAEPFLSFTTSVATLSYERASNAHSFFDVSCGAVQVQDLRPGRLVHTLLAPSAESDLAVAAGPGADGGGGAGGAGGGGGGGARTQAHPSAPTPQTVVHYASRNSTGQGSTLSVVFNALSINVAVDPLLKLGTYIR